MSLIDQLPFPPDDELRQFLEEYERTDGHMDEPRANAKKAVRRISDRAKLTNLYQVRRERHLTQVVLAQKVGTTQRTITAIENGSQEPSVFIALAIAEALEVKIEEIFYLKPPQMPRDDFDKDNWIVVSKAKRRPYEL